MKEMRYRDTDTSKNIDRAEAREIENEYYETELNKVCSPCEFEDFKEWINEETDWAVFETGAWINTSSLRVIGTQTLYKLYLNARESQNS